MYLHSDINAFYCSVEQIFRPDIAGLPVIVGSNNDGAIVALNQEAKALGMKRGQPLFQVMDLVRRHNVQLFSSNYTLYADLSSRFHTIVGQQVPKHSVYSIDELFASLHGMDKLVNYQEFGLTLRESIYRATSLTCGIGIAPTLTLCKCATWAAKKYKKTEGVVVLDNPQRRDRLLSLMEVGDIWGIGKRLARRLNNAGIYTGLDLAQSDTRLVRQLLGVGGERTARELRGTPCYSPDDAPHEQQQLVVSRSFGERITELEMMQQAICAFTCRAGEKLRLLSQYASSVSVFIQNSAYSKAEPYFSGLATEHLSATQDSRNLVQAAQSALLKVWKPGIHYAKAGILLSEMSNGRDQLELFDDGPARHRNPALMQVIDRLNHNGRGTIFLAGEGIHKTYQMKQQWLSPCYTTRWKDLPIAYIK